VIAVVKLVQNDGYQPNFIEITKIFELIVFIRLLKLVPLLYEIRSFRIILETIKYMLEPASSLLIITTMILFEFALLGMYLFGGKV
jgi:hypothetical protein